MKKILTVLFFIIISLNVFSQKKFSKKIGLTTRDELELNVYEKDSTAKALVLEDYVNVYVDPENGYNYRSDYYKRVKFFEKSKAEDRATIRLRTYKEQKIKYIKAVTYSLLGHKIKTTYVTKDQIYKKEISENWKEVSFTLPNIQDGCVIEYSYSFIDISSDIKDWYFQDNIPVKESLLRASIPGNWNFNAKLVGFESFDIEDVSIQKDCLTFSGASRDASCVLVEYGMKDVPAFKEENHMLSKKNFLSRLSFELESFTGVDGTVKKYTKSWKDADKTFKNYFLDGQTSKEDYFKRKLPENLFLIKDQLERAKKTFYYIQDRMTWNDYYWTTRHLKVKKIFDTKKGSVDAINLVLYNSLQAIGIESSIVALSTRDNGVLTKLYPVVDDFNYVIVKAKINGEAYFLDATDKLLPFGQVPMRCLNGEARVLDFDKVSYWEEIKSRFKSSVRVFSQLSLNEENQLTGLVSISKKGYYALKEKSRFKNKTKEEILDGFESSHPSVEANDVEVSGLEDNEKSITTSYKVNVDVDEQGNELRINPFFYNRNTKNPFKLKERNYPVDYGYTRSISSVVDIEIPKGYKVKSLPKAIGIALPNKGGKYFLKVRTEESKISIFSRVDINKKTFSSEEYFYLKEFYKEIINSQKALIILEEI